LFQLGLTLIDLYCLGCVHTSDFEVQSCSQVRFMSKKLASDHCDYKAKLRICLHVRFLSPVLELGAFYADEVSIILVKFGFSSDRPEQNDGQSSSSNF